MGTSRSSKPRSDHANPTHAKHAACWRITASLYSGRPDPEWTIPDSLVAQALEIWSRLPFAPAPVAPPPLGYRGITLLCPDGRRWTAAHNRVTHTPSSPDPSPETRLDAAGTFERLLLGSAPSGMLPPHPGPRYQ